MKQQKNYSLEEISDMVAEYFERISDITNFKIVKMGDSYACIDTIFKREKNVPRIKIINEYGLFQLFKLVSKMPEDTIRYFHLSSEQRETFKVVYDLDGQPRTRKR